MLSQAEKAMSRMETITPPRPQVAVSASATRAASGQVKVHAKDVSVYYGDKQALFDVSLDMPEKSVTALIGPSGCGKSTFLRSINRMNDTIPGCRVTGRIAIDGDDINDRSVDATLLRAQVGMVFQKPNPFPKSIYDNVAYGVRLHGLASGRKELDQIVESSLHKAGLWDEVKDRLAAPGMSLSGGQQQRLVIARAIAVSPEIILMDEPCSALDPISTLAIEDLIEDLKTQYTIVIVTHNMQQASRVSDRTAFFNIEGTGKPGKLIEYDDTTKMFSMPSVKATEDYVSGKFG